MTPRPPWASCSSSSPGSSPGRPSSGSAWSTTGTSPPPTQIVHAAYELAQEPRPRLALLGVLGMFLAAFAVAVVVGVLAGAAMGLSRIVHPFVLGLFSTTKMIFILVFGLGATSRISYTAVSAFFPVAATVTARVRTVD